MLQDEVGKRELTRGLIVRIVMASKRFVKPVKPIPTIVKSFDWEAFDKNRSKLARNEYAYCMAEAKRIHPEWTLKQRQEYASRSVDSMFD